MKNGLVYPVSGWNKYLLNEYCEARPEVITDIKDGLKISPFYKSFVEETFGRLYEYEDLKKLDNIQPEARWSECAHAEAENLKEWKILREQCTGDEAWSGVAANSIANNIKKAIPKVDDDVSNIKDKRQEIDSLKSLLNNEKINLPDADIDNLKSKLSDAEFDYNKMLDSLSNQFNNIDDHKLRQIIRDGATDASNEIDEMKEACEVFGFGDQVGGGGKLSNVKSKLQLAERLKDSYKLKKIIDLAGRFKNVASEKRATKTEYARSEVKTIEQGSQLQFILPSEMLMLADPELEDIFYSKLTEGSLLQYKLDGKEKAKCGPIVILIDSSGSMDGTREIWSKAIALGMMQSAIEQKRPFIAAQFDTRINAELIVEKEVEAEKIIVFCEKFSCGGTNIHEAFKYGMKQIVDAKDSGKPFADADLIIITDGCWYPNDAQIKNVIDCKNDVGFDCQTVIIGNSKNENLENFGSVYYLNNSDLEESTSNEVGAINSIFTDIAKR